ncbi:ABC transporter permease [Companilactobacillus allii]|uniref:Antibiotic ABC transporter permease n=1 Tax=Companilactobacillus allii TaxID=1847728 RepID=A0A1P8Q3A7_9LACO|nr:ABC transporter permease [Companilactobacillus allii]APX72331.1 antibiotic ABC transporter permease [Companilactobacillus allii]USQ69423.1 ABC transporter permease [Companilactobacillus allii]
MRTIAIMTRVLKELIRDKRTLALMFIAPVVILLLLSFIFNSNSSTNVNIATVDLPSALYNNVNDMKHVDVYKYSNKKAAKRALNNDTIDAIIQKKNDNYDLTYANTDSTKTAAVKQVFNASMTKTNVSKMKKQLVTTTTALAKLTGQTVPINTKISTPKITNHYVYGNKDTGFFDKILPVLMGFFVFFFVFLISGMALLKERTSGTLDRLLATPVKRFEIVFGYMLSYGILAVVQTVIIVLATVWMLGIQIKGNIISVIIINLILALVALAFGILLSTFAKSEFQMMQFIPIVVIPQVFFSGIVPLDSMAKWVSDISYVIPIKYSGDAVSDIIMKGTSIWSLGFDISVLLGILVVLTILNIVGLRRYRKV